MAETRWKVIVARLGRHDSQGNEPVIDKAEFEIAAPTALEALEAAVEAMTGPRDP
jgi:hypothetical protein